MKLQASMAARTSLREQVEREVQLRTGGRIRGLQVDVVGDRVVLSGRTATYYGKQLATHAVFDILEDVRLSNDIEVG